MCKHVEYISYICNQRLYLLNQIKKQGLSMPQLHEVFEAIVLSRVIYAVQSCGEHQNRKSTDFLLKPSGEDL